MTTDAQDLARLLFETTPAVMRSMGAQVRLRRHSFFHNHYRILRMLSHGECSMSELARRNGVSLPSMSSTARTLEERGWLERVRSPQDRRMVHLRTSRKGRQVLQSEHERMTTWLAEQLESLSAEEKESLRTGLLALKRVFEASWDSPEGDDNKRKS
jgi:DNA-binding MarR family transcriptional regulator